MTAATTTDDYRDFVASFADPLSRLEFLLCFGAPGAPGAQGGPADLATDALARLRWRWREIEAAGAPESLAVEALVANVRRRFRHARTRAVVDEPPVEVDSGLDVDVQAMRDRTWAAWQHLPPRRRLPLVLADLSVASHRLSGIDVDRSDRSARRDSMTVDGVLTELRGALLRDPVIGRAAAVLDADGLAELVRDTLRERAAAAAGSVDPYRRVDEFARRRRRRLASASALVGVALVASVVLAVQVSTPKSTKAVAAASASGATAAGPTVANDGKNVVVGGPAAGPVVNWPARGNAATDAVLLSQLKASFVQSHPNVIGSAQVLLAADGSAFRMAYVVGNSPRGVVASWFYGAVGSTNLIEGASSFGNSFVQNTTVIAATLIDTQDDAQLVVIAPPFATNFTISNYDPTIPLAPGGEPLPDQHGVAVRVLPPPAASTVVVHVQLGAIDVLRASLPTVKVGQALATSAFPLTGTASGGRPDPQVLAAALAIADIWHKTDAPSKPLQLRVLWGGSDVAGTEVVVVRMKITTSDLVLVEWNDDAPGQHAEYLLPTARADTPLAFAYRGIDGTRIGVLSTPGVAYAALVVGGSASLPVGFDHTGFASLRYPGVRPIGGIVVKVNLLGANQQVVRTIPMPPLG